MSGLRVVLFRVSYHCFQYQKDKNTAIIFLTISRQSYKVPGYLYFISVSVFQVQSVPKSLSATTIVIWIHLQFSSATLFCFSIKQTFSTSPWGETSNSISVPSPCKTTDSINYNQSQTQFEKAPTNKPELNQTETINNICLLNNPLT